MARLFAVITLILAVVLSPPAVLAVVSNNAVPGDVTYPIKRGLEDIIYAVASVHPNTKALFAKARSDRRFQEITALLTQGKKANKTLQELVEQTQAAASQIEGISDLNQKGKLISQLSDSITKYNKGLTEVSQPKLESPAPTSPTQSPTPAPSVSPSPTPEPDPELEKTKEELERIRKRLEELERQRQIQMQQLSQLQDQIQNATPNPTPTAIPTFTPTLTPSLAQDEDSSEAGTSSVDQNFLEPNQESTESATTSSSLAPEN